MINSNEIPRRRMPVPRKGTGRPAVPVDPDMLKRFGTFRKKRSNGCGDDLAAGLTPLPSRPDRHNRKILEL